MKRNVLIIIAAVITVFFGSCSTNYQKEVNNRIEKLKKQGIKILAHSYDDTGNEHYIVYKTDAELIYDDIDSKKVILKKGQQPNQIILDIDSLNPNLITKVIPCSAQYDIVGAVLEKARIAIVENGFVYVKEKENDWWGVILSSDLPNVVMMENWDITDKGNLKVTGISNNAAGIRIEDFIKRIYGNTSILNTMQSKIMGYESEDGLVTREAAINSKGEIAEASPNYIIREEGNRPNLYFEYPADELKDADGIKKFISIYDAAYMKEVVEPFEEQKRQEEEARREQEYDYFEEYHNTIYNYECKYCHSIIQMQNKGYDFNTGQCPYNNNFKHHWERIE